MPEENRATRDLAVDVARWRDAFGRLPDPGSGDTISRWRVLADIAEEDLCLVKVLEAHYDANAILEELKAPLESDPLLAVWAAEGPDARLAFNADGGAGGGVLEGTKAWCSGADLVDAALVTAQHGDQKVLVHVHLDQPGIRYDDSTWHAVGMQRVRSGTVEFRAARATAVGLPGAYLQRPGFWHGGAGIAACWFGGARAIARTLHTSPRIDSCPHAQAHLGAIDVALSQLASLLRETAALIDAAPRQPHVMEVLRVRNSAERLAAVVLDRVGRALGASPLCTDASHAQRCADLAVFIRQSHAERDWAELGRRVAEERLPWTL